MDYPTRGEVEAAKHHQLGFWWRYLPSPDSDDEVEILNFIIRRCEFLGGMTEEISKQIGWRPNG